MTTTKDINQWRRMIQPARTRTPARDLDDSEGLLSPTTPRKGLKPKLSSYFNQHITSTATTRVEVSHDEDILNSQWPSYSANDPAHIPNPDTERLIEVVMCRLLEVPHRTLEPRFNGILMTIFESYRNLMDETQHLQDKLRDEAGKRSNLELEMHRLAGEWDREKQEYKAEVKRLELILSKGKRGVAEVTLARQDSLLRQRQRERSEMMEDKTLETIFEFLEKTKRYEDRAWSSQRATMRKRPASPSAPMRRLSRALTAKDTTPSPAKARSVAAAHRMSRWPNADAFCEITEATTAFSNETHSTFSGDGDPLPDETADVNLIEVAGTDNDLVAIKRIAQILAKRRQIDVDEMMPKLLVLFKEQDGISGGSRGKKGRTASKYQPRRSSSVESVPAGGAVHVDQSPTQQQDRRHPKLRTKASGLLSKLRPQLNVDTTSTGGRRFSFEPGDDNEASLSAVPPTDNLPAAVRDRLLRKTVSMSMLGDVQSSPSAVLQDPELSPVQQSPTASAPASDSKRPSRIPTPVFSSGSLARPRRERDDSATSLLTAIRYADQLSQRSDSVSGSANNSPEASHTNLIQGLQGNDRAPASNPLLDRTNLLHGNTSSSNSAKVVNAMEMDNLA